MQYLFGRCRCHLSITDYAGSLWKIVAPTGESLIHAFARMIFSAIREYSIISKVTRFDLVDARVVVLDLDEVARSGVDAGNRQTAVMYMLARYVLGRHYFLTDDNLADMPESYRHYHQSRIAEIRKDPLPKGELFTFSDKRPVAIVESKTQ